MLTKPLVILLVIVLIAAGLLYYFLATEKIQIAPLEKLKGLGGEIYEMTGNPSQNVPDTNPFDEVESNPLKGTNPFEDAYKNPFE